MATHSNSRCVSTNLGRSYMNGYSIPVRGSFEIGVWPKLNEQLLVTFHLTHLMELFGVA